MHRLGMGPLRSLTIFRLLKMETEGNICSYDPLKIVVYSLDFT